MAFYLQIEVNSSLSPDEFRTRVILPLAEVLLRESLGRILDDDPEDEPGAEGQYEFALEVTDQERAKKVVEEILNSVDA
jgi:hypothetical protein